LAAQLNELLLENQSLKDELSSKTESNKVLVDDLFTANRTISETNALLAAANEKIRELVSAPPTPNEAFNKLQADLKLANETKSELENMTTTRVRTLTNSLQALEESLRESTSQNERTKAMHKDEVEYLMEQLTKREKEIHSLSRSLTVAEVDSDWRRLLGINKASNGLATDAAAAPLHPPTSSSSAVAAETAKPPNLHLHAPITNTNPNPNAYAQANPNSNFNSNASLNANVNNNANANANTNANANASAHQHAIRQIAPPDPTFSRNNSDATSSSSVALEKELEAQKRDIDSYAPAHLSQPSTLSHFVDFERERMRKRLQTEEKEAMMRSAHESYLQQEEAKKYMMSGDGARGALYPTQVQRNDDPSTQQPKRSQSPLIPMEAPPPPPPPPPAAGSNHLQNPHLQQHKGQLRNFHSSAIGNLLSFSSSEVWVPNPTTNDRQTQDAKTFGVSSEDQHNRPHARRQLVDHHNNLTTLSDYAPLSSDSKEGLTYGVSSEDHHNRPHARRQLAENHDNLKSLSDYAPLSSDSKEGKPRQRVMTVHGVKSEEFGERSLRPGRKHIEGPGRGQDGGFRGVLEGVYGTDDALPQVRQRAAKLTTKKEGHREVEDGALAQKAAGTSPSRDFSPFSKPVGKFSLNRKSSAPFATEETVRKVRLLVEEEEKKLMDLGLNAVLLKSEADRISRAKRTAGNMRRTKEIEDLLGEGNKESSRLRRSLKEKKEHLGLS
ncbi:hypothetical protein TrRE_jg8921, partial [Triparma retinervis]